jgi:hypothetical protein
MQSALIQWRMRRKAIIPVTVVAREQGLLIVCPFKTHGEVVPGLF